MIKFIGIKNLIDSKESLLGYGFLYTLKNDDVENAEGRRLYRNIFTVHVPEELSLPQLIEELATHPDIRKIHLVSISE